MERCLLLPRVYMREIQCYLRVEITISSTFERWIQKPYQDHYQVGNEEWYHKITLTGTTHALQLQRTPAQS